MKNLLDLPVEQWTSKQFVMLFYRELQQAYELPPKGDYHTINWPRDTMDMKNRVVSWFVEHGYGLDEVKRFIEWFFRQHIPRQKNLSSVPHMNWLPHAIIEYLARNRVKRLDTKPESTFRREAYNNDLAYFGMAYKHGEEHKFSRLEYWLGFWWRRRNLSPEEMVEYRSKQRAALVRRFDELEAGVHLFRFRMWEEWYVSKRRRLGRQEWNVRMKRVFIKVQARRRGWKKSRVREHYGMEG